MITKEKEQKIKELHKRLDWYYDCASDEEFDVDEVISLLSEYYGAAEPPVRCGESHLSGLTEPLRSL